MSRTLFLYIFRDLFRIFLMASGALAGIMSFGGLLRPLTREGLDAAQVARMLAYFGPAMTTYSFPVAALFATAVVYGRLAADNELTACKAGGLSLVSLTVTGPALLLGLIVAITSLIFLCFVVPYSTLQVEKVIYSNLAKLVETRIERNHEIGLADTTIFAQSARVLAPDTNRPGQQLVELIGPEIISVERDLHGPDKTLLIPKEFYTASKAYVYIDPQQSGQDVNVTVNLVRGIKFPRKFEGATEAGIAATSYGPLEIPSPIKEDVKFMSVWELKALYANLSSSRRLQGIIADFVRNGQRDTFLTELEKDINGPAHSRAFTTESGSIYTLTNEGGRGLAVAHNGEMTAPNLPVQLTEPIDRPITLRQRRADQPTLVVHSASVTVHARPIRDSGLVDVNIELHDCVQTMESQSGKPDPMQPRPSFKQQFTVPMSAQGRALAGQDIAFFERHENARLGDQSRLTREKVTLMNNIIAESNGRASFAVSCLILVMLGSALGMMFRSGNFLTAFAVSFVPALLSITLIIAGQRTAGNLPRVFTGNNGVLSLGLALIWGGNAVNLLLATFMLWKVQKQ